MSIEQQAMVAEWMHGVTTKRVVMSSNPAGVINFWNFFKVFIKVKGHRSRDLPVFGDREYTVGS